MSLWKRALATIARALPAEKVYAHCDIPCGIYDPIAAKIAAQTVQKMVMRIQALKPAGEGDAAYHNSLTRYIAVKEEHSQVCKKELSILWGDYFKPEHLEKAPDLHKTVWNIMKLASKNRQEVNPQAAQDLLAEVQKFAVAF